MNIFCLQCLLLEGICRHLLMFQTLRALFMKHGKYMTL